MVGSRTGTGASFTHAGSIGNTASRSTCSPLQRVVSWPTNKKPSPAWIASTPRPLGVRLAFQLSGTPVRGSSAAMPLRATAPGPSLLPFGDGYGLFSHRWWPPT